MKYEFRKFYKFFSQWVKSLPLLFLLACHQNPPNQSGNYRVRIPLDDGTGHYSEQTVEIPNVKNLAAMATDTVVVRNEGTPSVEADSNGNLTSADPSFGNTPNAHFLKVGDIYYPSDYETLAMSTLLYHFSSIKTFFDRFGANEGLAFPRMVMNDVAEFKVNDQVVPMSNNARYVPFFDVFWINPYSEDNVSLAFNGGVLAHEYTHSIFQVESKKYEKLKLDLKTTLEDEWQKYKARSSQECKTAFPSDDDKEVKLSLSEMKKANNLISGALNEAIADYYGFEYSKNPSFIMASFSNATDRDLSKEKKFLFSYNQQKSWIKNSLSKDSCGIDTHAVGAYFAAFLYLASCPHDDVKLPGEIHCPKDALGSEGTQRQTLKFISRYLKQLDENFTTEFVSLGEAVKLFFKGLGKKGSESELCRQTANLFPGELKISDFCPEEKKKK